jgi:hypothetical protein
MSPRIPGSSLLIGWLQPTSHHLVWRLPHACLTRNDRPKCMCDANAKEAPGENKPSSPQQFERCRKRRTKPSWRRKPEPGDDGPTFVGRVLSPAGENPEWSVRSRMKPTDLEFLYFLVRTTPSVN